MLSAVIVFVFLSGVQGITHEDCPAKGHSDNGYWYVNTAKEKPRCVLHCYEGYEPDGCHVLRIIRPGTWNRNTPQCVEKSSMPWGTLAKAFKGAAVSSRSAFAALHGAGAAGLAFGTQACVFSGITAVTGTVSTFLGSEACEDE